MDVHYGDIFAAPHHVRASALERMRPHMKDIVHSHRYRDDTHEYRHVMIPRSFVTMYGVPCDHRLLTEEECADIGITQSLGWRHYMLHRNEPHVLLFRRPLDAVETGKIAQAYERLDHARQRAVAARLRLLGMREARQMQQQMEGAAQA